jgi:hypothetical protein
MNKIFKSIAFLALLISFGCGGVNDDNPFTGDLASVFPKEVNINGTTYRRLELNSLKPESAKKYFKNLNEADAKNLLDALYLSPKEEAEGVMVARFPSVEDAKKAMLEMSKDEVHKDMTLWTRGNLVFRASHSRFKDQMLN